MEEIISQLEIFYAIGPHFLREYPDADSFLFLNGGAGSFNAFTIFANEYDYTLYQVYTIFRKMFLFFR
jgi:hypothetical protein